MPITEICKNYKKKYAIYIKKFNENSGGLVCLAYLCYLLNKIGESAYVATTTSNHGYFTNSLNFNLPVLDKAEIDDSTIVVYPEIIDHNPLNAKNVVRWLLHKPGFHTGRINFGNNELIVGYGKETCSDRYAIDDNHILKIEYIMNIYYNKKLRKDMTCYSIRKSRLKNINMHPSDSICIDRKSHSQINDIFNMSHTFISYDPYSYYSIYAAMCGCDSIVVPEPNVNKDQWKPNIKDTYGLAYGFDDIEYARSTKHLLFDKIANQNSTNIKMVKNFTQLCEAYFI